MVETSIEGSEAGVFAHIGIGANIREFEQAGKKMGDEFIKRVQSGIERTVKSSGMDKYSPIQPTASTGGIMGKTVIAAGVVGGLVAGGITGLMGMIANSIKDFPIVVAIMKLFGMILMMLFLPLIPVLKPIMTMMGSFIKSQAAALKGMAPEDQKVVAMGLIASMAGGWLAGGPFGALTAGLGAALMVPLGDSIGILIAKLLHLGDGVSATTQTIAASTAALKISVPAQPQPSVIPVGASSGSSGGGSSSGGGNVGGTSLSGGWFNSASGAFQLPNSVTIPSAQLPSGNVTPGDVIGIIKSSGSGGNGSGSGGYGNLPFGDFMITPQGVIRHSSDDYIIGTKNPGGSMGGGITLNVNNPTIRSDQDIKTLVREISQELYKQQKRYSSYG